MAGTVTVIDAPPLIQEADAARGKVKVYHQKGIPLPEGWAFESEGRRAAGPSCASSSRSTTPLNDRLCSEVTGQSGFLRQSFRAGHESEGARICPFQIFCKPYSFFEFCRLGVDKEQECPSGEICAR